jgi:hypothetical protein
MSLILSLRNPLGANEPPYLRPVNQDVPRSVDSDPNFQRIAVAPDLHDGNRDFGAVRQGQDERLLWFPSQNQHEKHPPAVRGRRAFSSVRLAPRQLALPRAS